MTNFRDNLKKAFNEAFSINDLYGGNRYDAKILKEIDPNDGAETDDDTENLDDPTVDATPEPEENTKETDVTDDVADTSDDSSSDVEEPASPGEPKERPEPEEIEPPTPITPIETPEQKVNRLYSDTGDVDADYSVTSESNIRLAKFKFDNAGIVLDKVLTEDDLKGGISTKDIENRLTPEQTEIYKEKNKELRKKYPLIDKREKMCLIHNARIPMTKRDVQFY